MVPNSGRARAGRAAAARNRISVHAGTGALQGAARGAASEIMHDGPPAYLVYQDSGACSC